MRIVLLVLLCLGVAMPAEAQKKPSSADKAKARALYDEGLRFYNVGEYDRAVEKFKESYVVVAAPLLLFNIAQAYRLKGDCDQALRSYRTYLREVPKPDNKELVAEAIAICEQKAKTQPDKPIPPPAPADPAAQPDPIAPVVADTTPVEEVTDAEVDTEVDDAPAQPGRTKQIIGIALGATGLALAGTGVYVGLRASSQASDIEEFDGVWDEEWESTEAAQKRNRVLGPVLIGAGVGAIAGGVVLFMMGRREAEAGTQVSVAPRGDGVALVVTGRW